MAQQPTISYSWSSGSAPVTGPDYILAPNDVFETARQQFLVVPRWQGERILLDAQVTQALMLCDRFRPIGEHVKRITSQIPSLRGATSQVAGVLRQMASMKLLITRQEALSRLRSSSREAAAVTPDIFIRTCDRPHELTRLLGQIAAVEARRESSRRFVVVDDSRQAESRALNEKSVMANSELIRIEYFGRERQANSLKHIHAEQAELGGAADWLLDYDRYRDAYTPGLGLNWALLLSSGSTALLLDDDCELLVRPSPEVATRAQLGTMGRSARFNGAALRERIMLEEEFNPFEAHTRMLGRTLGEVLAEYDESSEPELSLSHRELDQIDSGSRIVLTANGTFGDPGIDRPHWLSDLDQASIESLLADGSGYAENSRARDLWIGRRALTFSPNTGSMATSVLLGVDNREPLPPVFPQFRSEDFLLGALSSFVVPRAMAVEFPWGMQHVPVRERHWQREQFARPYEVGILRVFADLAGNHKQGLKASTPDTRLTRLGELYTDHAELDDTALSRMIEEHVTYARTDLVKAGERALSQLASTGDGWREDLERLVQTNLSEAVSGPAASLREMGTRLDCGQLRESLARYGQAIGAWASLREQGASLLNAPTVTKS